MSKNYNEFKEWIKQSKYGFVDTYEMELESDQKIFDKFESERNNEEEELENLTWKEMNERYYGVGDSNHDYAFGYIDKKLGDFLLSKYTINEEGIKIASLENFNLDDLPPKWSFEDLFYRGLCYEPDFEHYENFDDFIKGEELQQWNSTDESKGDSE